MLPTRASGERRRIKAGGRQRAAELCSPATADCQRVFIDHILRKALALASAIEKSIDGF